MLDCRPFYIAGFNVETIGQMAHRDFAGPAGLRGVAVLGCAPLLVEAVGKHVLDGAFCTDAYVPV